MGKGAHSKGGKRGNSDRVPVDTEALTCLKETGFTWETMRLELVDFRRPEMEKRGEKGDPGPSEKTWDRIRKKGEATEDFAASLLGVVRKIIKNRHKEWGHNGNRPVEDLLPFSLADWGPVWEQIKEDRRRRIAERNAGKESGTSEAA